MNKLVVAVIGLVVLMADGPTIVAVLHALIPVIAVGGFVALLARVVWFYTR